MYLLVRDVGIVPSGLPRYPLFHISEPPLQLVGFPLPAGLRFGGQDEAHAAGLLVSNVRVCLSCPCRRNPLRSLSILLGPLRRLSFLARLRLSRQLNSPPARLLVRDVRVRRRCFTCGFQLLLTFCIFPSKLLGLRCLPLFGALCCFGATLLKGAELWLLFLLLTPTKHRGKQSGPLSPGPRPSPNPKTDFWWPETFLHTTG